MKVKIEVNMEESKAYLNLGGVYIKLLCDELPALSDRLILSNNVINWIVKIFSSSEFIRSKYKTAQDLVDSGEGLLGLLRCKECKEWGIVEAKTAFDDTNYSEKGDLNILCTGSKPHPVVIGHEVLQSAFLEYADTTKNSTITSAVSRPVI